MDKKIFFVKYGDLDTYDKFIERIVELHKTYIYHTNVNGVQLITKNIQEITKAKCNIEASITELIKLKNGFNNLDDHLIFDNEKYNEIVRDIKILSSKAYSLCGDMFTPADKHSSELPVLSVLNEKNELIKFLNVLLYNTEDVKLNNNIINLATVKNKPLNSIAKVDIIREAYDKVIGKEVKENHNKNSQFVEQYKEYKSNQNKNQKGKVVKVVAEPIDPANPSDGRDVK